MSKLKATLRQQLERAKQDVRSPQMTHVYTEAMKHLPSLEGYLHRLLEANLHVNLVGTMDLETLITKHVIDSLLGLPSFPKAGKTIVDLGSGAGFPGVILSVLLEENRFYWIESKTYKVDFLRYIQRSLRLRHVDVLHANVREVSAAQLSYGADVITMRALYTTAKALKMTRRLRDAASQYVFYKGKRARLQEELRHVKSYRINVMRVYLPFREDERHMVQLTPKG